MNEKFNEADYVYTINKLTLTCLIAIMEMDDLEEELERKANNPEYTQTTRDLVREAYEELTLIRVRLLKHTTRYSKLPGERSTIPQ